jgi:cytosine/adenosine deaminase-related metal-dependent hydrolase
MSETLIRDAYVLTMDEELGTIPHGDVLIRDWEIAAVGPDLQAPGAEVIDGAGRVVMPGLIDGHRHMFSGLLRGGCSDVRYTGNQGGYFEIVIRRFGGSYTPQDTYWASRIGALESLNGGITTLHGWEHNMISYDHALASARAMHETGLRGRFSYGPPNDTMIVDRDGVGRLRDEMFPQRNGFWETTDGRWHLALATRGVELDNRDIWEGEAEFARTEGLPLTAHLMRAGHVTELRDKDLLGPDLFACHALGVTDEEIELLRASDTPVCASTPALARTGGRGTPIVRLMKGGVRLCLAVDSTAGCDTADMWAVMRITMIVERMLHEDAGVYSSQDALAQSTIESARSLGLGDVTGSLTPGKRADVIMVSTKALNLAPFTVPETLIAACVYPSNVETVFVDGQCLKRDGALIGVDLDATVEEANAVFQGLEQRVGAQLQ